MKELLKTKRITIAIIAFVVVLIIGFASLNEPVYQYKVKAGTFVEELFSIYQVTPDEAMEWMFDSTMAVFIDVRSVHDFERGHIENAINIPVPSLLDEANKMLYDKWKSDSLTVVLYGNDELQANAPWMLMYELGYTNMRVLLGGYGYIDRLYLDELEVGETYTIEDPAFDFAGLIKEVEESKKNVTVVEKKPKKEIVVKRKVKKSAEGGC